MIKRDLAKMTHNISQPELISKINQGFNKDVKSLMTFNNPDKPHKVIVCNQETDTKYNAIYKINAGVE